MRLSVRVRPGAGRAVVCGRYGDSDTLCVAVRERAVDGAATEAVLSAVAAAFGLAPRDVRLVRGASSRTKLLDLAGPPEELGRRLGELLGGP